ncbi:MAG TPA: hypothetical protein V6D50_04160 [Chroococcales cyanobacterium]|jgi:hypothetical protein
MAQHSFWTYFSSLCLVFLAIASTNAQQKPSTYPPDVVRSYITSCTAGRGPAVQAICACTIRKIQTKYSLEAFKKINNDIAAGRPIPRDILEMLQSCQVNPNSQLRSNGYISMKAKIPDAIASH